MTVGRNDACPPAAHPSSTRSPHRGFPLYRKHWNKTRREHDWPEGNSYGNIFLLSIHERLFFSAFGFWLLLFPPPDLKIMSSTLGGFLVCLLMWITIGNVWRFFSDEEKGGIE
ncbi:MAG: hypothetical protein ACLSHC_06960 [Bilophila wadsworthia]